MKTKLLSLLLVWFIVHSGWAQEEPVLTFKLPTQNALLLNRFIMNPTFSAVRETETYLTLYHRSQWIEFDDSPELYMLSYTGRYGERAGVGIGLFQQNLGVITSFGGVGNYAYEIQLQEKMKLTLGFNLAYYTTGVNRNRVVSNEPDPQILALRNQSVLTLNPGLNLTWGSFDLGVSVDNAVDYNFKSSETIKDFSEKTFNSHLMYHHQMEAQEGMFESGFFRLLLRGKINQTDGFQMGGSVLVNYPKLGWIQAGVDDFYGVGIGGGAHLTQKLSLGYTYERVINEGLVNFGPTHEITLSYRFNSGNQISNTRNSVKKPQPVKPLKTKKIAFQETEEFEEEFEEPEIETEKTTPSIPVKTKPSTSTKAKTASKANSRYDRNGEIEKLKLTLSEDHLKLLDMIIKQDSVESMAKEEFEKRIENLIQYIKRLETTIAEKDCNCETPEAMVTEEKTVTTTTKTMVNNKVIKNETKEEYDITTKLASMKSATKKENIKIETPKKASKEQEIERKLTEIKSSTTPNDNSAKTKFKLTDDEIKEYYSKLTDKKRATARKNIYLQVDNQEPGFYIIANVFSDPTFAEDFLQKLKKQGVKANYFVNPKNNYRYVYLKKHSEWSEALISYYTNVDNTYFDEIWIMNINIK
ncbi:PorP/SprF family type IX secretion system membrane protein [Flavobacterium sp.]|uniref:PorP/SprF family type IX secretion system membrane protein n=1 Tax=Flavobacterium sp. TaxID=239 RepID=UPI002FDA8AB2